MELELATAEELAPLLTIAAIARRRGRPKGPGRKTGTTEGRPLGCTSKNLCGKCRICQSDREWDRIFKAKFEDPAYYQEPPRAAHCRSALSEFA